MKLFKNFKQVLALILILVLTLGSVLIAGAHGDYDRESDLEMNVTVDDVDDQSSYGVYDLESSHGVYDLESSYDDYYSEESENPDSPQNEITGELEEPNEDEIFEDNEDEEFAPFSTMLTVVFNGNGGIISEGQGTRTVMAGTSITTANMPTVPSRADWVFKGWTRNADGSGSAFTGATTVTQAMANAQGEVHVYAQWGHAVRFFGNPTILSGSDDHATAGNQNSATNWGTRVVPDNTSVNAAPGMVWPNNPPPRVGRSFVGWFSTYEIDGGYAPGTVGEGFTGDTLITSRVDLFARWVLNEIYTVTFNAGPDSDVIPGHSPVWEVYGGMNVLQSSRIGATGGGVAVDSEILNQGNVPVISPTTLWPNLPNATPRPGLTHFGWSTVPNPSTANFLFHGADMAVNNNITVHAVWVHRVTFNGHTGQPGGNSWRDIPEADSGQSVGTHGRLSSSTTGGSSNVILNAEIVGMPENPVRPGFEFIGWTTDWTGMTPLNNYFTDLVAAQNRVNFDANTPITSNTAVHGVWLRNPDRTVTFYSNGGTPLDWTVAIVPDGGAQSSRSSSFGDRYRYFPIHPTRPNYVFMGWYIGNELNDGGNGGIPAYRYRTDTIVESDLHVWAHWVPAVPVTFMPNGGGGTPQTVMVPQGMTWSDMSASMRSTSSYNGYAFAGTLHMPAHLFTQPPNHAPVLTTTLSRNNNWNTAPDGTGIVFNLNTLVESPMTVYRVWFVNVTFNNNHVRFAPGSPNATHNTHNTIVTGHSFSNNHLHGNTPVNPPAFRTITNWGALPVSGRSFVGFNTDSGAYPTTVTGWVDAHTILNENTVLFGIFSSGVVFNSGAAPMEVILPQHRERLPEFMGQQIQDTPGGMPPDPVWPGQVFYGWNTNINGTGTRITGTSAVGATLRVYAIWDSTITFDGNGGVLHPSTVSPIVARAGSLYGGILPPAANAPTRTGYVFAGWNTAPDGSGMEITPTTPVGESTTLFAQWTPILMHTVTFNLNGGTQAAGENPALLVQKVLPGDNATMIANPTRPGYNFVSWAVDPVGATVTNVQGDITFTAVWTQVVLPTLTGTVTCDATGDFIPNVTIRLYQYVNGVWQYLRFQQTNVNGVFDFGAVPVGPIRVIKDYDTIPTGHVVTHGGNRYLNTSPEGAYEEHFRIAPAPEPPAEGTGTTPDGRAPRTGDSSGFLVAFYMLMIAMSTLLIMSILWQERRRVLKR